MTRKHQHWHNYSVTNLSKIDTPSSTRVKTTPLPRGYQLKRPCIDCSAGEGEYCISATGKSLSQVHISRRRIAIREYRAEQEAKGDD